MAAILGVMLFVRGDGHARLVAEELACLPDQLRFILRSPAMVCFVAIGAVLTVDVAITGLGCVSPLGVGREENWCRALSGRSAIRRTRIGGADEADPLELPLARIDDDRLSAPASLQPRLFHQLDRVCRLALIAAAEAYADAGLVPGGAGQTATVIGCASGGQVALESSYREFLVDGQRRLAPLTLPRIMGSSVASAITMALGLHGPAWCVNSACASSSHAIAQGFELVRSGRVARALVGGADASLTHGHLLSWQALGALSREACRPFSAGRDGTVLGEGAGMLLLEEAGCARARGARIHGYLRAAGASADAFHLTRPSIDGAVAAIAEALAGAGLDDQTAWLIVAHGTGTTANDAAEASALRRLFGAGIDRARLTATKALHGHLLGATAAVELVLGITALERGVCPPLANYLGPDPECDLPLLEDVSPRTALLANSFAFGGLNSALVVTR